MLYHSHPTCKVWLYHQDLEIISFFKNLGIDIPCWANNLKFTISSLLFIVVKVSNFFVEIM